MTITSIEVLGFTRDADGATVQIDLRCGAGTYVRSLARDLGARLGCGGYLVALRRTESAGLRAEDAITPQQLEALAADGRLGDAVLPVGDLLPLPRLTLGATAADAFVHGSATQAEAGADGEGRHAVFAGGALLGIGVLTGGVLHPEKVVAPEGSA